MVRYRIIAMILGMLSFSEVFHTEAAVVINEVLADPPSGDRGDANRDGIRDGNKDEFVEILNTGSDTIAIGGWQLSDRGTEESKRFAFPSDTVIAPDEYIVLFGGGDTTKIRSAFEGQVFVNDGKIGGGLSNSKDAVFLFNPTSNDTIASAEWGKEGSKDQSLVRYPEGTGRWVLHSDSPGRGLFSPGKPRSFFDILQSLPEYLDMIEGEFVYLVPAIYSYETGETRRIEDEVLWVSWDTTIVRIEQGNKVVAVRTGETEVGFFWQDRESLHTYIRVLEKEKMALVISEVHPNPAWGDAGDTNGDGVRHTYQDEFVEVANLGEQPIDISGYFLGDNDAPVDRLFRFPDNTVLDTQAVVVLFGGGEIPVSDRIFADDGSIGDGLSNGGDTVQLLAPDGSTVISKMTYENAPKGISFARDDNGNYLLHNQIYEEESISIGRLGQGDDPVKFEELTVPDGLVFSEILMLPEQVDANNDEVVNKHTDAFVELTNIGVDTLDLSGWLLVDDDIIASRFFPFPDDVLLVPGGYVTIFVGGRLWVSPVLSCLPRGRLEMDSVPKRWRYRPSDHARW